MYKRQKESRAVVADLDGQQPRRPPQPHPDLAGACVLDHIGQGLGEHVPRGGLDLLRAARAAQHRVGLDHHAERQPGGPGLDRHQQAPVGEQRWVDRVRYLPYLNKEIFQVFLQLGEEFRHAGGVPVQTLPGGRQFGRQDHDLLLYAVMQLPLEAAALGILRGDDPRPGGRERCHPRAEAGEHRHTGRQQQQATTPHGLSVDGRARAAHPATSVRGGFPP